MPTPSSTQSFIPSISLLCLISISPSFSVDLSAFTSRPLIMQRQSLSVLQPLKIYNGTGESGLAAVEDVLTAASNSASSSSSASTDSPVMNGANCSAYFSTSVDSDGVEMNKHDKRNRSQLIAMYHSRPERFIHAIPLLIFLCVFALYLCSHEPSPKDLVHIHGFRLPSELTELTDIDYFERYTGKADIHSQTETEDDSLPQQPRNHRKLLTHIQV